MRGEPDNRSIPAIESRTGVQCDGRSGRNRRQRRRALSMASSADNAVHTGHSRAALTKMPLFPDTCWRTPTLLAIGVVGARGSVVLV